MEKPTNNMLKVGEEEGCGDMGQLISQLEGYGYIVENPGSEVSESLLGPFAEEVIKFTLTTAFKNN